MSEMKDVSDAIKGIVEAVPIYEDLLQPATKELGKGLHTLSKTVHIALAPVSALVWSYDKIRDFIESSVEKKLANVPIEEIVLPAPEVAVPIIEALRYTGHREELRDLFSNLLAKSMISMSAHTAHPAFVEIIKQLSPDEAKIIKQFNDDLPRPIIMMRSINQNTTYYFKHLEEFSLLPYISGCSNPELGPSYLNNLARLGLIATSYDTFVTTENAYNDLYKHPIVTFEKQIISATGQTPEIQRGTAARTAFGKSFFNACII